MKMSDRRWIYTGTACINPSPPAVAHFAATRLPAYDCPEGYPAPQVKMENPGGGGLRVVITTPLLPLGSLWGRHWSLFGSLRSCFFFFLKVFFFQQRKLNGSLFLDQFFPFHIFFFIKVSNKLLRFILELLMLLIIRSRLIFWNHIPQLKRFYFIFLLLVRLF